MAFACIGGYVGYNMEGWEKGLLDAVNEKRSGRGMLPVTRKAIE